MLLRIRELMRRDVERITKIIGRFDNDGYAYSSDDVVAEYNAHMAKYTLCNYMDDIILSLKANGNIRTSEIYRATLNSFEKFTVETNQLPGRLANRQTLIDDIDANLMKSFEAWHKSRGNTPNTTSFYMRVLRAVYNRAVESDIINNHKPFSRVYTGIGKTAKGALNISAIRQLKRLDLAEEPSLDYARDMFMLSFMMRGMSFIDMAFLRKSDLKNGYLSYRRRKTGQQLTIEWTAGMQGVLQKYPHNPTDYLLPVIKSKSMNEWCAYRNAAYNINYSLKKIARMIGLQMPLTLYVARHSWASVAKAKGVPLSVISEGMGHDSEATTRIYLASLDTSAVDRANTMILSSL